MSEHLLRKRMAEVCARLYARGLIVAADGNVSCRLPGGRFLTTPSGVCKGFLAPSDLVVVDGAGRAVTPGKKPSTEFGMHLTCYAERPEVQAVVHAHPPIATAFSVAGVSLDAPILTEVVLTLGGIPTSRYGTPGTPEVSDAIRDVVRRAEAFLLDHHGAVTVGKDLEEAYHRMETVEQTAQVMLVATQLGGAKPLTPTQVEPLLAIRARNAGQTSGGPMVARAVVPAADPAVARSVVPRRMTEFPAAPRRD